MCSASFNATPPAHNLLRLAALDNVDTAPTIDTPDDTDVPVPLFVSSATPPPRRRWGQRGVERSFAGDGAEDHELAKAKACNQALQNEVEQMRSQLSQQRLRQEVHRLQQDQDFLHGQSSELLRLERESESLSCEIQQETQKFQLQREQFEQEKLRLEIIAKASNVGVRAVLDAMGTSNAASDRSYEY